MLRFALVALACALLLGCETTFEPFEEGDYYFSMYGYLDPGADTQFVRIMPLRGRLADETRTPEIDAAVDHLDLESGREARWHGALVRFLNGRTGHVFWTTERPAPSRTYRLTVRRSDGVASWVDVTVPEPPPEPAIGQPREFSLDVRRLVRWPEPFHIARLEMVYHVRDLEAPDPRARHEVVVPYTAAFQRLPDRSEVIIDLTRDANAVMAALELPPNAPRSRVMLLDLELRLIRVSEDWDFISSGIDIESLALPEAYSNVEHGFGFVGALVRASYRWSLVEDLVAALGYTDGQGGGGG